MFSWLRRRRPQPAPWIEPRHVSEQGNRQAYAELKARLDIVSREGRESIYCDRYTGLYWKGVALDYGPIGAADEQLIPLSERPADL